MGIYGEIDDKPLEFRASYFQTQSGGPPKKIVCLYDFVFTHPTHPTADIPHKQP